MSNILELTLEVTVDNDRNTIINISNNENEKYEFNLNDEKYESIDLFIDYLLKYIAESNDSSLNIKIKDFENLTEIDKEIANSFKNIWENDFKKIIKEINCDNEDK